MTAYKLSYKTASKLLVRQLIRRAYNAQRLLICSLTRYLSYVMDVASPTKDCLDLIHDFLLPIIMKSNYKTVLSHQENRLLGEIDEQIQQILASTFENYNNGPKFQFLSLAASQSKDS